MITNRQSFPHFVIKKIKMTRIVRHIRLIYLKNHAYGYRGMNLRTYLAYSLKIAKKVSEKTCCLILEATGELHCQWLGLISYLDNRFKIFFKTWVTSNIQKLDMKLSFLVFNKDECQRHRT